MTAPNTTASIPAEGTHSTAGKVATGLLILGVGLSAICLKPFVPGTNDVIIALALGLLIANGLPTPIRLDPDATDFVLKRVLKLAVIGLGAGVHLDILFGLGWQSFGIITVTVLLAVGTSLSAGRWLGLRPSSSLLIGVGTAVCGGSAIVAVAPLMRARRSEVGISLATIFALNAVALIAYPLIGHIVNMPPSLFGAWVGLAVHDTASAIGTGFSLGQVAGEVATIVKLARTLYLIPIMVAISLSMRFLVGRESPSTSENRHWAASMPWFIVGFSLLAALNSLDLLLGIGPAVNELARYLVVFVVATLALTIRVRDVLRLGAQLFWTGLVASGVVSVASLLLILRFKLGGA